MTESSRSESMLFERATAERVAAWWLYRYALASVALTCCNCAPTPDAPPAPAVESPALTTEAAPASEQVFPLPASGSVTREIGVGETHVWTFELSQGEFAQLEFEQQGSDVVLELEAPAVTLPKVDSSNDATRVEPILLVAESSGHHRVRVEADPGGTYIARWIERRAATSADVERTRAHWDFYGARQQRSTPAEAIGLYRRASDRWRALSEAKLEARARFELAEMLHGHGPRDQALAEYRRAAELFETLPETRQEARCLHRWGRLHSRGRELELAAELYARALDLWHEVGNSHEVANLAFDLAWIERQLGRPEAALRHFLLALDAAPGHGQPLFHAAKVRAGLGALYVYRGETTSGLREMRRALRLLGQHPQSDHRRIKKERARTLTRLASALQGLPDVDTETLTEAYALLAEARALREEVGEQQGVAMTVNSLGLVHEKMNRPQQALAAFDRAEVLYRELDQTANAAVAHGHRCRIIERLGQAVTARDCYLEALAELRQGGYQSAEAGTLFNLATNARQRDAVHEALRWSREALAVLELIRIQSADANRRAAFLDRRYDTYRLAVDLALKLHRLEPEQGHAEAAFRYLESARALGLLESLTRFGSLPEPTPELRQLQAELHQLKIESLTGGEASGPDVARREAAIEERLEQLRLARPRHGLAEPRILASSEVRDLLDSETLLLEYHLGETHGAVWAITESEVAWRSLGSSAAIERAARELHEALRGGAHAIRVWNVERTSRELSRLILEPVADLLDRRRLVVVPAGALHYVPFAALPHPASFEDPATEAELLLQTHEISTLPSASVLAALRRRDAGRPPAKELLALVAAPVLRADDERFPPSTKQAAGVREPHTGALPVSIPHAAMEAEAILRVVGRENVRAALGFDANRDFVFSGALNGVRILHFATHGHLDDTRGELSGLALSRLDRAGHGIDSYLWAYELYDLDLRADLVVLSACETALGEALRGEGLVGLTRGFLYAGVRRVLVSLWEVDDEATALLMESFYRAHLEDDLSPAAALRQAQIDLRDRGWDAAYFWAAFVLQGDWRSAASGSTAAAQKNSSPF